MHIGNPSNSKSLIDIYKVSILLCIWIILGYWNRHIVCQKNEIITYLMSSMDIIYAEVGGNVQQWRYQCWSWSIVMFITPLLVLWLIVGNAYLNDNWRTMMTMMMMKTTTYIINTFYITHDRMHIILYMHSMSYIICLAFSEE